MFQKHDLYPPFWNYKIALLYPTALHSALHYCLTHCVTYCVTDNVTNRVRDHSHITSAPKPMVTLPSSPIRQQPSTFFKFFTHLPSLSSTTVNSFVFFKPLSPITFSSKTLRSTFPCYRQQPFTFLLLLTHPPILPSTTVNKFWIPNPPTLHP